MRHERQASYDSAMRFLLPAILFLPLAFSQNLTDQYRSTADRLIHAALADNDGYAKLAYLCDRIGNRLSGSESLDRAIAWAEETMKRDGLSNVRTIPVKVPHWVRGANRRDCWRRRISRSTCSDWE